MLDLHSTYVYRLSNLALRLHLLLHYAMDILAAAVAG
jgi:hypothetical protein